MKATEVTVGIGVKNLSRSRQLYERLLEKPPELEPVPGIVEFNIAGTWLQLDESHPREANWVFRIGVPDISQERKRVAELGIEAGDIETVPGLISWFMFKDPDGNKLSFYQLLASGTP